MRSPPPPPTGGSCRFQEMGENNRDLCGSSNASVFRAPAAFFSFPPSGVEAWGCGVRACVRALGLREVR